MALMGLCQHSCFLVTEKTALLSTKISILATKKRLIYFYITAPFRIFAKKYTLT